MPTAAARTARCALALLACGAAAPPALADPPAEGVLCQARRTIGRLAIPDPCHYASENCAVLVEGTTAYIASAGGVLSIVDVSDPTAPTLTARMDAGAEYIDVQDGLAFITEGSHDIRIVDVSDPAAPALLSTIPTGFQPGAVDAVGPLLFASARPDALAVFDISDPARPARIGGIPGAYTLENLRVVGPLAYAVDSAGRLDVFDVSDPAAPFVVSRTTIGEGPEGLAVVGGVAYAIASRLGTVVTLDVSDPAAPVVLGRLDAGPARDICVSGGVGYCAAGTLVVLDASDPAAPAVAGEVELMRSGGRAVEVVGDLAYVLDCGFGLEIIDVSGSPTGAALGDGGYRYTAPRGVALVDDLAAVSTAFGLEVYDLSGPDDPVLVGTALDVGFYGRVRASGRAAYTLGDAGIRVFDIADPAAPAAIALIDGPVGRFDLAGDILAVAAGESGLRLIDVSDPAAPVDAGSYAPGTSIEDVALSGGVAYLADPQAGLRVIGIADPAAPVLLATLPLTGCTAVDAAGTLACVATDPGRVLLVDISDPAAPEPLATLETGRTLDWVRIAGGLLFVGSIYDHTTQVVDIADPSAPALVGWFASAGNPPVRRGDRVYHTRGRLTVSGLADCIACAADFSGDGGLGVEDVARFVNLFTAGDGRADLNGDGRLDFFDLQTFLALFAAGCP